jgi:membrane associated rhomboid family serine protease
MEHKINYGECEDSELIEIYGRLDPSLAPALSEQVKRLLIDRGFVLPEGDVRLGYEILPSRDKLQELLGVRAPITTKVFLGDTPGRLGWLQPARNSFNMVGDGIFEADGIYIKMFGPRSFIPVGIRNRIFKKGIKLNWRRIVDVEVQDNAIRLGYQVPGEPNAAIGLWFPDRQIAAKIADVLPKMRTQQFQPRLSADVEYQEQLLRQPPSSAGTLSLLTASFLLFIAAALGGAGWFVPNLDLETAAGSNFGPLTTHGEWWRLVTALFVHFGLLHLLFNMLSLAVFGALAERLFGIANFLFIYFVSGIAANLTSLTLKPAIDTAGASGAIFGILGALLVVYWRNRRTVPFSIIRAERTGIIVFTGLALLSGFLSKQVDNGAHVGGLVTGLMLGLTLTQAKRGSAGNIGKRAPAVRTILAAAVILACGVAGAMYASTAHQVSTTHKPPST